MSHIRQHAISIAKTDEAILSRALKREDKGQTRPAPRSTFNERHLTLVRAARDAHAFDDQGSQERDDQKKTPYPNAVIAKNAPRTRRHKTTSAQTRQRDGEVPTSSRLRTRQTPKDSKERPREKTQGLISRLQAFPLGLRRAFMVFGCVALIAVFFYGPVADLYAASRDHDQLVLEVEALNTVADDLASDVARLQTEEGVTDEARVRGYAPQGEYAADASELLDMDEKPKIPELSRSRVSSDDPPLTKMLDAIFGYEGLRS